MKIRFIIFFLLAIFTNCKENAGIGEFDTAKTYIYFGYKNPADNPKEIYLDSIHYSFAHDDKINLEHKTIELPVLISGLASNSDRKYTYVITPDSDYDPALVQLSEAVIEAGEYQNVLNIKIVNGKELLTKKMSLNIELQEDANFKLGHVYNRKFKITFDNILNEPEWWEEWKDYFGPYYKEVFHKWKEIYFLGTDPTPEYYDNLPGPYYYWNRMPEFMDTSLYPVTFMHIELLKKYFDENEVYPNNDEKENRIQLP